MFSASDLRNWLVQFQLTVVQGGTVLMERFPFVIGRDPSCELSVPVSGIFSRHAELRLMSQGMVEIVPLGEALVLVNEQPVVAYRLKNGERFRCGAAEFQFSLSPGRLRRLGMRETLFWLAAVFLFLLQVLIVLRL
ncbi:MAG TPA: FHA domain-containing protein [Candidatus Limnocylindria bacterium]|jgi:hypothetical protein|nr:FHA domain-containing protein [Candidatus Limnocylindria bacterium]